MPKETPSAAQLFNGEVAFFSIDTDLIQSAGYSFHKGALNLLPDQLPATMELQLTEIVAQEIVSHRMRDVTEAAKRLSQASKDLARLTKIQMAGIDKEIDALNIEANARTSFLKEITDYATRCRGGVLKVEGQQLAVDLFGLYFSGVAPFENSKAKKSEFPDAASLLLLEAYAKDHDVQGVLASGDKGWKSFAENSEWLYCVNSIELLASLFKATGEHPIAVKQKIIELIKDQNSTLRSLLKEELEYHVSDASWDADEIFSVNGRVESEVFDAELIEYDVDFDDVNVWNDKTHPGTWVVELTSSVKASVDVSVEFFVWDSIDREELSLGSDVFEFTKEFQVEAYLRCSNVSLDGPPEDWVVHVEIADGRYSIDECEVDLDLSGDD